MGKTDGPVREPYPKTAKDHANVKQQHIKVLAEEEPKKSTGEYDGCCNDKIDVKKGRLKNKFNLPY